MSPGFYNELKKIIEDSLQSEHYKRKEKSQIEKNQAERKKLTEIYDHYVPQKVHEVWATDFTMIPVLGMNFYICLIYEQYSQAYLSLEVSFTADADLAMRAMLKAVEYTGTAPSEFILSDNGSQFIGNEFEGLIEGMKITHKLTPPGQPWYNGALESGNFPCKTTIYVVLAQLFANNPALSKAGQSEEQILASIELACAEAQVIINEKIPRPKHKTTPKAVLLGEEKQRVKENEAYIERQKIYRKERMEKIKASKKPSKYKSLFEKAKKVLHGKVKDMSSEMIYTSLRLLKRDLSIVTE
jgi:transposase InsO family protein